MDVNDLTSEIISAAIKVHTVLGPGLLESVYEEALCFELIKRGLHVQRQKPIPVFYDGEKLEVGFRADLIVDWEVLIEVKSTEEVTRVHKKITLNYLRLTGLRIALLINFNEELLKNGITRLINDP